MTDEVYVGRVRRNALRSPVRAPLRRRPPGAPRQARPDDGGAATTCRFGASRLAPARRRFGRRRRRARRPCDALRSARKQFQMINEVIDPPRLQASGPTGGGADGARRRASARASAPARSSRPAPAAERRQAQRHTTILIGVSGALTARSASGASTPTAASTRSAAYWGGPTRDATPTTCAPAASGAAAATPAPLVHGGALARHQRRAQRLGARSSAVPDRTTICTATPRTRRRGAVILPAAPVARFNTLRVAAATWTATATWRDVVRQRARVISSPGTAIATRALARASAPGARGQLPRALSRRARGFSAACRARAGGASAIVLSSATSSRTATSMRSSAPCVPARSLLLNTRRDARAVRVSLALPVVQRADQPVVAMGDVDGDGDDVAVVIVREQRATPSTPTARHLIVSSAQPRPRRCLPPPPLLALARARAGESARVRLMRSSLRALALGLGDGALRAARRVLGAARRAPAAVRQPADDRQRRRPRGLRVRRRRPCYTRAIECRLNARARASPGRVAVRVPDRLGRARAGARARDGTAPGAMVEDIYVWDGGSARRLPNERTIVAFTDLFDVRVDGLRGGRERHGARGGAHAGRAVVVRMRRLSHSPVDQHRRRGQRPSVSAQAWT